MTSTESSIPMTCPFTNLEPFLLDLPLDPDLFRVVVPLHPWPWRPLRVHLDPVGVEAVPAHVALPALAALERLVLAVVLVGHVVVHGLPANRPEGAARARASLCSSNQRH